MSYIDIVNFLNVQASANEELRIILEQLAKQMKRFSELKAQELVLRDEEFHLQMEKQMWESFADHVEDNNEQNIENTKMIDELYDSNEALRAEFRRLELNKLVGYEVQVQEAKLQQEKQEMEEMFRRQRENYDRMENREIAKKLRLAQKQSEDALKKLQQAEADKKSTFEGQSKKLEFKIEQRNKTILEMVDNAKHLDILREHQNMSTIDVVQNTENLYQLTTMDTITTYGIHGSNLFEARPVFDPCNPMAFLKSLNLDIATNQIMEEFSFKLQQKMLLKEADKDLSHVAEPRPILRNKSAYEDFAQRKSVTHHVHFMDHNGDVNSSISLSVSSSQVGEEDVNNDLLINATATPTPTETSLDDGIETVDLLTPTNDASKHCFQIVECKIVKPAGAPLPKSIPFTLSSSPTLSLTESDFSVEKHKDASVDAKSSKMFKAPAPPAPAEMLKNDLDISAKQIIESKSLPQEKKDPKTSSQSIKKKNTEFNFESLLFSNKSPSESEEFLDFCTGTNANTNTFLFDSDGNEENQNAANSDMEFEFNLIGSDTVNNEPGKHIFQL